ncbi:MAG: WYL domain-containing protein [Lachnospiraceae bacterium]|nr:WYL domain-containing protein [Lachnospiraceae bacterium]
MELFSEIYSCYYQVLRHLLLCQNPLTIEDVRREICREGFEESLISIIPKLEDGTWNLFKKDGNIYRSKLNTAFSMPLSHLEQSYLKALLTDPRIRLFLDQRQSDSLNDLLASVAPLWKQQQFYYYDRFTDGDPYDDKNYHSIFRTLLLALKQKQYVDIDYNSPRGNRIHHHFFPARLEYSVKNDKFRLLALKQSKDNKMKLETLNLSRMERVNPINKTLSSSVDLNAIIKNSYYADPLRLRIINKRNALERAMLHFANYEKNTTKIDENTFECLIYYNQTMETELLIEVMSFGPMLKVLGNDKFLQSLRARLQMQIEITGFQT